jgi:hypothetical protein
MQSWWEQSRDTSQSQVLICKESTFKIAPVQPHVHGADGGDICAQHTVNKGSCPFSHGRLHLRTDMRNKIGYTYIVAASTWQPPPGQADDMLCARSEHLDYNIVTQGPRLVRRPLLTHPSWPSLEMNITAVSV